MTSTSTSPGDAVIPAPDTPARVYARPLHALRRRPALLVGLLAGLGVLLLAMLASIAFGAADIAPRDVWAALFAFNPESTNHLVIRELRIPRAAVAALVGGALAVAGALMQGLTRNPMADPGILGINAGAALGVVAAVTFLQIGSLTYYMLFALLGATLTALIVYGLGSMGYGGATPLKLTIAGVALTALLSSFTTGLLIFNERTLEEVRFWLAGSLAGRNLTLLAQAAPFLIGGLILASLLGRQVTALALGEDVAKGLGQNTAWVKALTALAIVLLASGAVAVAGPIAFVGLIIPHMVRFFVGVDYRWIVPYSALLGAVFLILADIAARVVIRPMELPVGVMTALIGGPLFIYLARARVRR